MKLFVFLPVLMWLCNRSAAQSWVPVGSPDFTRDSAAFPSIAIGPNGVPYVVYEDGSFSRATVKKFNDTAWVTVGSAMFSAGSVEQTCIAISSSGTPYVVYTDFAYGGRLTVKKFNDTDWVTVGREGFTENPGYFESITIDRSGAPYVAYADGNLRFGVATVKKFADTGWQTVGVAGFSAGLAEGLSIAIGPLGTPYVAYTDFADTEKATVMKYNGSAWVNVGAQGFSLGQADWVSLAIDHSGIPYVAYMDVVSGYGATVKKFNGTAWVNVGAPGFTPGVARSTSLAIDSAGTPFVAFQALPCWGCTAYGPASAMKFDGTGWVGMGSISVSPDPTYFTNMTVTPAGVPYVVLTDSTAGNKVTVMIPGPVCPVTGDSVVCLGDAAITLHDSCAGGVWSSSDTGIATVGFASGIVKGVSVGTVTISYTISGSADTKVITVSPCLVNNGVKGINPQGPILFTVQPNPSSGDFVVSLSAPVSESALVEVKNLLGQKVAEFVLETNKDQMVHLNVASGIYFLSATAGQGAVTGKVIIQ